MKAKALFSNWRFYFGWALVSALVLVAASYIDPYLFGLVAFGSAFVSGLLLLAAAILSWRNVIFAMAAGIPTALAFVLLSTYKWA